MGLPWVDEHLHYFAFPALDTASAAGLVDYADALEPALIIFDSLTDMLAAAGVDENDGVEVTGWMNCVPQALARRPYAPAVVLIDHVTKDSANTKYSVASRAKKAKSDILWYVDKHGDFDRTTTTSVDLIRHKNRPGLLPKKVRYIIGGSDGQLVCEPYDVARNGASALSPQAHELLKALEERGGRAESGELARSLGVNRTTVARQAKELVQKGYIERTGAGRASGFAIAARSDSIDA